MGKINVIFMGMLLLCTSFTYANPSIIIVVKDTFNEGEKVQFDYQIVTTEDMDIEYWANVICENSPMALFEDKKAFIKADEPYYNTYEYGLVDEKVSDDDCKATVTITSPIELTYSKTFHIDALDSFDIDVTEKSAPSRGLASTRSVSKFKKVYMLGEKVKLEYTADTKGAKLNSILTYPNGTKKQLTLPATIDANQLGTYSLDIAATKEGYKDVHQIQSFAVIQNQVILAPSSCNNNICDDGETNDNCPSDCSISATVGRAFSFNAIASNGIFVLSILVIVLLGFGVWFVLSKKKTNKKKRRKKAL